MDHSYYKDRVSAWIDQELPPYEQEALTRHVAECEECRTLAEKLRQVDNLINQHSSIGGSDEYWEQLARKTEARIGINQESNVTSIAPSARSSTVGLRWKIVAVAASVAVLTFVGWHQQDIFKDMFTQEAIRPANEVRQTAPVATDSVGRIAPEEAKLEKSAVGDEETTELREESPTMEGRDEDKLDAAVTEQPATVYRAAPAPVTAGEAQQEMQPKEEASMPLRPETDAATARDNRTEEAKSTIETTAKDLKDQLLGKSAQVQPQTFAKPEVAGKVESETIDIASDSTMQLAYWRGVRDSLLALYPLAESKGEGKRKRTVQTSAAGERPDSLLAHSLFKVASASDDQDEIETCVRQLQTLSESSTHPAVNRYLEAARALKK